MNKSRVLIIVASILLFGIFFWPIWEIKLYAPQYPDGVALYIYADKLGGSTPGALQNINILNHYVGMKPIDPDSIPELKYIPKIIIFFIILGFVTAFIDKKWMYLIWVILFALTLIIGLYDFYLWEYDYGHNLDENAPMKFDESFQPPLIGKKNIINFTAYSLPQITGWLFLISLILASVATKLKFKKI